MSWCALHRGQVTSSRLLVDQGGLVAIEMTNIGQEFPKSKFLCIDAFKYLKREYDPFGLDVHRGWTTSRSSTQSHT